MQAIASFYTLVFECDLVSYCCFNIFLFCFDIILEHVSELNGRNHASTSL